MKYKITLISIFILFILSFYFQNRYAIFYNDDWNYAFIVNKDYRNFQSVTDDNVIRQPVKSLHDAIVSQSRDYFKTNGRFIVHTTVQYFCGTKTMEQFAIINSFMFAIFMILVIRLINCKLTIWYLSMLISSVWILLPHKGLTFMGNITCSVNYLWSSVGTLLFLLLYHKLVQRNKYSLPLFILFTFYSFIAGSLQESFSIGVSAALFIYIVYKYKTINRQILSISLAYIIGTCVCMFTPANFRRFDDINGAGFHVNSILGLLSSPTFILLIIVLIILARKNLLIEKLKENYFIVAPIFFNLTFILFIAYNGRHQLTSINVFSLIFLFRIWGNYNNELVKRLATITLTSIALVSYYPILKERKAYHNAYMTVIDRIQQSHNEIVSGTEFETKTETIKNNRILEGNYISVFTFQDWDFYEKSLSIYLSKGDNNILVKEVIK